MIVDSGVEALEDDGDDTLGTIEATRHVSFALFKPLQNYAPVCAGIPRLALSVGRQDATLSVEDPFRKARTEHSASKSPRHLDTSLTGG